MEVAALRAQLFPREQQRVEGPLAVAVTSASVALSLITLYFAFTVTIGEVRTRSLHLLFTIPLALVLYPARIPAKRISRWWIDAPLSLMAAGAFAFAFYRADAWLDRFVGYDTAVRSAGLESIRVEIPIDDPKACAAEAVKLSTERLVTS